MEKQALQEIRGAVYEGNGPRLLAALAGQRWVSVPQLVGDGLLTALADGLDRAADPARRCVRELRERLWTGDEELAAQLEAALGEGPIPMLRPLPVDLEDLSSVLEGDPAQGGGRINLTTGEVRPDYSDLDGDEDDEEPEDGWLYVGCLGSRSAYGDMEDFIETLGSGRLAGRLGRAISGRGAFRRFKDVLAEQPDQLERWYAFSNERQRGRARAWLADEGYAP